MSSIISKQQIFGRKRHFAFAGLFNVIATNVLLQILLRGQWLSTGWATLISQAFNGFLGYTIYGKWVFQFPRIRSMRPIILYATMMVLLWGFNTFGIYTLAKLNLVPQRNFAALSLIIPLAALSYSLQKMVVFRQPSSLSQ